MRDAVDERQPVVTEARCVSGSCRNRHGDESDRAPDPVPLRLTLKAVPTLMMAASNEQISGVRTSVTSHA